MIGQFKCGCVVSAQFNSEPPADFFDRPCPGCERPLPDKKWAAIGAELKRRRQDAHVEYMHKYSVLDVAQTLGLKSSDISAMEHGRKNPAPLVAFWEGQDA